jgi:hypothetical protein
VAGGADQAVITMTPDPLDLGTDASATVELSASRLIGVRVRLDGEIATVATMTSPLGWAGGGCGDGDGEVLEITIIRTGGTSGATYTGHVVVTDDAGQETVFDVSLSVATHMLATATGQGWNYIWAMEDAGTSQNNDGTAGAKALTLTQARATTTQAGALGRAPIPGISDRASATSVTMGAGAKSVVLCYHVTSLAEPTALFCGGSSLGANNWGYLAIKDGSFKFRHGTSFTELVTLAPASTGVWLFGLSSNAAGNLTCWARKVGGSRADSSATHGTTGGGGGLDLCGWKRDKLQLGPRRYTVLGAADDHINDICRV